jgi:AbrB family looped-hinge helix DNA binding protein
MVKLQKQVAYKYKGHKIYKYRINVPSDAIEQLDWEHGAELEVNVKDNKLEIEKVK